ncbi:RecQ mediated genome instability 1 [Cricetulus griseus]
MSVNSAVLRVETWLLATWHVKVPLTWLEACVNWIQEENDNTSLSQAQVNKQVLEQWLLTDLRDLEHPLLPDNILEIPKGELNGFYALQINSLVDVSQPAYSQIQKLRGKNTTNDLVSAETQITPKPWEARPSRMLMLQLTDGVTQIQGMEYQSIPALHGGLPPGTKILVHGRISFRLGVLLLKPENVKVLGGEVDGLSEEYAQEKVLGRLIGELDPTVSVVPNNSDHSMSRVSGGLDPALGPSDEELLASLYESEEPAANNDASTGGSCFSTGSSLNTTSTGQSDFEPGYSISSRQKEKPNQSVHFTDGEFDDFSLEEALLLEETVQKEQMETKALQPPTLKKNTDKRGEIFSHKPNTQNHTALIRKQGNSNCNEKKLSEQIIHEDKFFGCPSARDSHKTVLAHDFTNDKGPVPSTLWVLPLADDHGLYKTSRLVTTVAWASLMRDCSLSFPDNGTVTWMTDCSLCFPDDELNRNLVVWVESAVSPSLASEKATTVRILGFPEVFLQISLQVCKRSVAGWEDESQENRGNPMLHKGGASISSPSLTGCSASFFTCSLLFFEQEMNFCWVCWHAFPSESDTEDDKSSDCRRWMKAILTSTTVCGYENGSSENYLPSHQLKYRRHVLFELTGGRGTRVSQRAAMMAAAVSRGRQERDSIIPGVLAQLIGAFRVINPRFKYNWTLIDRSSNVRCGPWNTERQTSFPAEHEIVKYLLEQRFSTFLMLRPFDTVISSCCGDPSHKVIFVAASELYFATVMKRYGSFRIGDVLSRGVATHGLRTSVLEVVSLLENRNSFSHLAITTTRTPNAMFLPIVIHINRDGSDICSPSVIDPGEAQDFDCTAPFRINHNPSQ